MKMVTKPKKALFFLLAFLMFAYVCVMNIQGSLHDGEKTATRYLSVYWSAQKTYEVMNGNYATPEELAESDIIDQDLANAILNPGIYVVEGYIYNMKVERDEEGNITRWDIECAPLSYGETGRRQFYLMSEQTQIFVNDPGHDTLGNLPGLAGNFYEEVLPEGWELLKR